MRKTRDEETRNEEDDSSRMTTIESFDFEDVWSFNHPHLSMKDHQV